MLLNDLIINLELGIIGQNIENVLYSVLSPTSYLITYIIIQKCSWRYRPLYFTYPYPLIPRMHQQHHCCCLGSPYIHFVPSTWLKSLLQLSFQPCCGLRICQMVILIIFDVGSFFAFDICNIYSPLPSQVLPC